MEGPPGPRLPSYGEAAHRPEPRPELSPITIDGNLIYPVNPPATALYELSRNLDPTNRTIRVSRLSATSGSQQTSAPTRDRHIYDFSQPPFSSKIEIVGKRRSSLAGTLYFQTTRALFKQGWELYRTRTGSQLKETIFRVRPTRNPEKQDKLQWEDAQHSLVAVETVCKPELPHSRPVLHIVQDLDDPMVDAMVVAWCAKIWLNRQAAGVGTGSKDMDTFKRRLVYGTGIESRGTDPGTHGLARRT
ncbi:hypothetical protein FQN57_001728 [Myotisia sp. PD_48]|nr:hypothetical protein FQN57_001728 [Myotisia sp. PD_48]